MSLRPILTQRYFTYEDLYSDIDWTDRSRVIDAFEKRLRGWYIDPAKTLRSSSSHYGFSIVGLCCLLIDTLSQYEAGAAESSRNVFMEWVTQKLTSFSGRLPSSINALRAGGGSRVIETYAEAFYYGFRCGILHEAHIPLYGAVVGQSTVVDFHSSGYTEYDDGSPCPTVTIDPGKLLEEVEIAFAGYMASLRGSGPEWSRFVAKAESSFGVTLTR